MKKILGAIFAIAAFAVGPALAADLGVAPAYKAAPAAPPSMSWSGAYVGLNIGGGIATGTFMDPCFTCADLSIHAPAFTGGGQVGYNWQWRAMVLGLEGDFNWMSADRTLTNAADDSEQIGTATLKMDAFASLRARMGLAYENALIYVTSGPVWGHFNSNVALCTSPLCVVTANDQSTSTDHTWLPGIAVGSGVEFMWTDQLSFRGEFLYMIFADDNTNYIVRSTGLPTHCIGTNPCGVNYSNTAAIARLGVNWKFH